MQFKQIMRYKLLIFRIRTNKCNQRKLHNIAQLPHLYDKEHLNRDNHKTDPQIQVMAAAVYGKLFADLWLYNTTVVTALII